MARSTVSCVEPGCAPHCAVFLSPVLQGEPGLPGRAGEMGVIGPPVSCRLRELEKKIKIKKISSVPFCTAPGPGWKPWVCGAAGAQRTTRKSGTYRPPWSPGSKGGCGTSGAAAWDAWIPQTCRFILYHVTCLLRRDFVAIQGQEDLREKE